MAERIFSGTARTETICAIEGRTPAIAWPVMTACVYDGWPKEAANAKVPFWSMPVATLVMNTVVRTNTKYSVTEAPVKRTVESANIVKQTISTSSAVAIRNGYEAPD